MDIIGPEVDLNFNLDEGVNVGLNSGPTLIEERHVVYNYRKKEMHG